MSRCFVPAALVLSLFAGGCAIEATGFATDFRTVSAGTARIATSEAVVGEDGRCQADASIDPASLRARTGRVEIGMSECQLVDLLGRADGVDVSRGASGERVARLEFDDQTATAGLAVYTFVGNRLTRVER